jgi:hypothetical protein
MRRSLPELWIIIFAFRRSRSGKAPRRSLSVWNSNACQNFSPAMTCSSFVLDQHFVDSQVCFLAPASRFPNPKVPSKPQTASSASPRTSLQSPTKSQRKLSPWLDLYLQLEYLHYNSRLGIERAFSRSLAIPTVPTASQCDWGVFSDSGQRREAP